MKRLKETIVPTTAEPMLDDGGSSPEQGFALSMLDASLDEE